MEEEPENIVPVERPKEFWRVVYIAVIVVNIITIALLWAFSRHFAGLV